MEENGNFIHETVYKENFLLSNKSAQLFDIFLKQSIGNKRIGLGRSNKPYVEYFLLEIVFY